MKLQKITRIRWYIWHKQFIRVHYMERHFSFLFLFIFAYSYQLTYGNDYEFVTRCVMRKKIHVFAELNLLIRQTLIYFFMKNFFFCSSQDVRLSPTQKKWSEGKIFYQHEGHRFPLNADTILSSLRSVNLFFFFISVQTHFVASFRSLLLFFFCNAFQCFIDLFYNLFSTNFYHSNERKFC